nr:MAG TPA: hypothetical protein [Inoviridae sp.]
MSALLTSLTTVGTQIFSTIGNICIQKSVRKGDIYVCSVDQLDHCWYSDLFYDWEYLYYHRRSADSASDGGISVCWWLCRYLWPSAFPWIIVFLVINERKCFLRLLLPILWLLCWLIWARLLVMFLPPLALYVLPLSMNLCFCLRLVSCLSEAVSVSSDVCSPVADCKRPRPDGFSRAGAFPCLRGVFHGYAV